MKKKEYDVWLDRFNREAGIRSSIILCGNTSDIMSNSLNSGKYDSIVDTVISNLRNKGYKKIIKWDRVDGIDKQVSDKLDYIIPKEENGATCNQEYNLGEDLCATDDSLCRKDPLEFFSYMLEIIRNGNGGAAFVLDYSDYLFGNANSLSEQERNYLAILGKALEKSKSYNVLSDEASFAGVGNLVVIILKNKATIPPAYYMNNSEVSTIIVPLPGRNEREKFIDMNIACLKLSQDLSRDALLKADFIDALDGFSLKEIVQIMKLSRQLSDEKMTFEKLISIYKYGERVSPWEELSKEKLSELTTRLSERVKGQEKAISKAKDVIIRAYTGFSGLQHSLKQKKPKGTLFFVGPTGVGKTELAKSIAEFIFGDENSCIRFDMSEFNHEHSDQKLIGAPPGYVGYEAGGQLTNAVRERPFCVLLFDEIEKAHGKILDKFLQILEDGRLTDGKGETVYFSETIIIFTSNIGAAEVDPNMKKEEVEKMFLDKVKQHFLSELRRPEILNRIGDNIVAFNFIHDLEVFTKIARIKFNAIENFVSEKYKAQVVFGNEEEAYKIIAKKAGVSSGGRGLLNIMETLIINPLSDFIFERSDILANRKIIIKPFVLENSEFKYFDFELE